MELEHGLYSKDSLIFFKVTLFYSLLDHSLDLEFDPVLD